MAKKRFDYFEAFEKQVDIASEEAEVLIEAIEGFTTSEDLVPILEKAHEIEHRGDEMNHIILTNVAVDFITPIDREDIIELAQDLVDIIDLIEGPIQRFYRFDVKAMEPEAIEFAVLIKKSLKALRKSMSTFREFKKVKKIRAMVEDVNQLEEQADVMYLETIRHLFTSGDAADLRVRVWSRLFEHLEMTVDACEVVADTMSTITLKNV